MRYTNEAQRALDATPIGRASVSTVPFGCNQCDGCGAISPVYDLWPTCRECSDTFCDDCHVPHSGDRSETGYTCLCRRCDDENQRTEGEQRADVQDADADADYDAREDTK